MGRLVALISGCALFAAFGLVAVGWFAAPEPGEPPAVSAAGAGKGAEADALREQIARLELRLAVEADARARLDERVQALELALADEGFEPVPERAGAPERAQPERDERGAEGRAERIAQAHAAGAAFGGLGRFDRERLVEAGFPASRVDAFKRRLDGVELDRLYLRDQALREGWIDSARYREERRAISGQVDEVRREFGDDLYDWSLWTSGAFNRLEIGDVIEGGAADAAGLAPGDTLLAYAGERVYTPWELRRGTTQGQPGESVPVEIERDGVRQRLYVPRGPLGVRTQATREEPPPLR